MRHRYTYIIYLLLPLVAIASVAAIVVPARQGGGVDYASISEPVAEVVSAISTQVVSSPNMDSKVEPFETESEIESLPADTVRKPRYTVRQTTLQRQDEKEPSADVKNPENLKSDVYYDEETGT